MNVFSLRGGESCRHNGDTAPCGRLGERFSGRKIASHLCLGLLLAVLGCGMVTVARAVEAPIARVDATDWIVSKQDATRYAPMRMIDGDETTSFQFSVSSTPLEREYLYFDFAAALDVDELWIKNGFWRITDGYDQYTRNSRIQTMTVDFWVAGGSEYQDAMSVTLPDDRIRADWTRVDLGEHNDVMGVRFHIEAIYEGTSFPTDVCVSEVRFTWGESGSAGELWGLTIDKLATRTGPSPGYEGGGTYNVQGQYIKVLSRAYDTVNGIWWVKCEIPYRGEIRVLWTGYKRFDPESLPLESIPIDPEYGGVR